MLDPEMESEIIDNRIQKMCPSIAHQLQGASVSCDDGFEQKF